MKKSILIVGLLLSVMAVAQPTVCVETGKTSSLVFPSAIKHVDRGSTALLAEPVETAGHILLLKAAEENMPPTNITVVTADGNLYTLQVSYGQAVSLNIGLPPSSATSFKEQAERLLDNPAVHRGPRKRKWGMEARLAGVYVKEDVIFLQLELRNRGYISYDTDYLRTSIGDRSQAKRRARQELELEPLYIAGNYLRIAGHGRSVIILALPKFTLPEGQQFTLELGEKNGGRHLALRLGNRHLARAHPLP